MLGEKKQEKITTPVCCGKLTELKFVERTALRKIYLFQCKKCGELIEKEIN